MLGAMLTYLFSSMAIKAVGRTAQMVVKDVRAQFREAHADRVSSLTAFVVAVLGGLGSLPGALLGGFIIGLIESMGEIFMPSPSMKQIASFSVFLLILLLRPQGLFGSKLT